MKKQTHENWYRTSRLTFHSSSQIQESVSGTI